MTAPQIEIKQGIAKSLLFDKNEYPEVDASWQAALVNPSTDMRYVADTTDDGEVICFTWPSGLKEVQGKLVPDDNYPNGTAHMDVGTYDIEIFLDDRSDMGTLYGGARVVSSNLMTENA